MAKRIVSIIGIIVCLSIIFSAGSISGPNLADTVEHASFGADFYTLSFKATRYAANNVRYAITSQQRAATGLMSAIGWIGLCFFLLKLLEGDLVADVKKFVTACKGLPAAFKKANAESKAALAKLKKDKAAKNSTPVEAASEAASEVADAVVTAVETAEEIAGETAESTDEPEA